jgi:hypothetical protein
VAPANRCRLAQAQSFALGVANAVATDTGPSFRSSFASAAHSLFTEALAVSSTSTSDRAPGAAFAAEKMAAL